MVPNTLPVGQGEPLNVIISANSHPTVLSDNGLQNYFLSLNFGISCYGINVGANQTANLGEGQGYGKSGFERDAGELTKNGP